MQYTIDIDPIIFQKAQLYAQEKGIDFNKYVEKQLTPSRAQGTKKTLVALLGVIVGLSQGNTYSFSTGFCSCHRDFYQKIY